MQWVVRWKEAQGTEEARQRSQPSPSPAQGLANAALTLLDSGSIQLPEMLAEKLRFANLSYLWVSISVKNSNWPESVQQKPEFQAKDVLLWFLGCLKKINDL